MPTDQQKRAFGDELRRLRLRWGWELKDAVRAFAEQGLDVPTSTLNTWELGKATPRKRSVVQTLDDLLAADGSLLESLGMERAPRTPVQKLGRGLAIMSPATMADIEDLEERLDRRLRAIEEALGVADRGAGSVAPLRAASEGRPGRPVRRGRRGEKAPEQPDDA